MSNEALSQLPHKLATLIRSLPQAPFREHLAAECIKQAERIAELEAERDQLRIDLDDELVNRDALDTMLTQCIAERDQLRAEVARLSVEVTAARENGFRDGYEQRHAEVLGALT